MGIKLLGMTMVDRVFSYKRDGVARYNLVFFFSISYHIIHMYMYGVTVEIMRCDKANEWAF